MRVKFDLGIVLLWVAGVIFGGLMAAYALSATTSDSDVRNLPNAPVVKPVLITTGVDENGNLIYAKTTSVTISSDVNEDEVQCDGLPNASDPRYVVSYGSLNNGGAVVECPVLTP